MTDTEKLELLKPAVQALITEVHNLGYSDLELSIQTKAAWVGELMGDGPHGIERTSIIETVEMTFDREQAAEAEREDAGESQLCWRCPLCGGLVPMSILPEDHACTLSKLTPALVLAAADSL